MRWDSLSDRAGRQESLTEPDAEPDGSSLKAEIRCLTTVYSFLF